MTEGPPRSHLIRPRRCTTLCCRDRGSDLHADEFAGERSHVQSHIRGDVQIDVAHVHLNSWAAGLDLRARAHQCGDGCQQQSAHEGIQCRNQATLDVTAILVAGAEAPAPAAGPGGLTEWLPITDPFFMTRRPHARNLRYEPRSADKMFELFRARFSPGFRRRVLILSFLWPGPARVTGRAYPGSPRRRQQCRVDPVRT